MQKHSGAASSSEWPKSELEYLGRCPACDSEQRAHFLDSLRDMAFGTAPGRWTMWKCTECQAAYLDPRPTEASIWRAYQNYYTHRMADQPSAPLSWSGLGMKGKIKRGYLNRHYGHHLHDALGIGWFVTMMRPILRARIDYLIRHLPPPRSQNAALLDIGCGNGAFLQIAKDFGYSPVGLEPDDAAARKGQQVGFDVRNIGLPNSGLPETYFEQITLNHVFEHFHKPRAAATEVYRLLKPGGRGWFSQPNLDSAGLKIFGPHWRGLEAPRHLSLYGPDGFTNLLTNIGFENIKLLSPQSDTEFYFSQSLAMSEGIIPQPNTTPKGWDAGWATRSREANRNAFRSPRIAESLTVVATKPQ